MRILFSPEIVKELKKIKRNNLRLSKRVEKQLSLFQNNPQHVSLRTHKLQGNLKNMWSISITEKIRMVYLLLSYQAAYFVAIGTHDEVYQK